MPNNAIEVCPVCGVKIIGKRVVQFSAGPPGDRARLWARVCKFVQDPGCINQDQAAIGPIRPQDYYGEGNG